MLADEKAGGSTDAPSNPDTPSADPFGDLKKKDEAKADSSDDSDMAMLESADSSVSAKGAKKEKAEATEVTENSDSSESSVAGQTETYTVHSGDTLMKIAFMIYGDVDRWKDLEEKNQGTLKNGNSLEKGMKLKYEAPAHQFRPEQLSHSYEIKKGDTLAGIAENLYGRRSKYKKLQAYNKNLIKNPNKIFAGFSIFYDITEKELAEAEAHRTQKAAGGGAAPAPADNNIPSAISPPPEAPAPNVAEAPAPIPPPTANEPPAPAPVPIAPSASDNSAVPGPGAQPSVPAPAH
jgi:LysM repeat protein